MIHQTKTKLFKIYMLLVAMVFLQSTYSQTINLNVTVNSLSHFSGGSGSNCGGNDGLLGALGNPDPRIMFRVKHSNTVTYSGEYKTQDPSGILDGDFYNISCGTFLPIVDPLLPLPYTQNNVPPTSTINVQLDGYEYDRIGANDGACGGYGDINGFLGTNPIHGQSLSPSITSIPPATSSGTIESYRTGCSSDGVTENYGARWSWTWTWTFTSLTDDNSGGTVALSTASDATICVGGDPGLINSTLDPLDPIPSTAGIDNIQWQQAQGPLFLWSDIGGATGLTYNPPILISPGQYRYRRKVTFRTENLLFPDKPIYSNEIQINVVADPNAPSATKVPNTASVCLGTSLTLSTPQYGTNPGKSCGFEYATSTNGGATWSATQTSIPTVTATGTNNLIRVRVAACTNGCDPSNWTNYAWNVISDTAAPTISGNLNVCTGSQTTLTALAPVASTVRWFSDAALTALVNTGTSYTPTINSDTSFWVVQIQGDCQSRATRVNVTALPAPPAPPIFADDQSICAGQNTNLTSSVSTIVWYRDDSRTSRLGIGTPVNTGNLAFTTTFYAADTSGASCPSPLSAITIDVAPAPDVANVLDQIICAGDSALLFGGTATTEWYSDRDLLNQLKIGSTYQTPPLTSTTTYYLQVPSSCGTAYDSVTVTVNPIPPAPTASDVKVCSGLSASIALDNTEPDAIVTWYDDVALENAIQVGSVLITPILTSNTTYYVTQTVLGCTSDSSSFNVTIVPSGNAPTITADPAVICSGDASTLSSNAATTIWYSDAGITRIGTGNSISVSPAATSTYYAQDTAIGCSALTSVTVQVSSVLPTPMIADVTVCKGADVTISGGNASTVWYLADQTTTVGVQGATLTLTDVQATVTYYARNEGSTCESAFDEFVVIVTEVAKPTASSTTICSGQSASLTATGAANATLTWYSDASLENIIQEGGLLNTPILTANTTYYVTQTVGGCTSDSIEVTVIVNPSGNAPTITADPAVICSGDASTLSSNAATTIWYSDAGITRIGTGNSISVSPAATSTYYAQDTAIGCSALTSVTVQVSSVLPTPMIADVTVCKGADITISGGNASTVWYLADQITTVGVQGATLTLTDVQATATYYARNEGSTCESAFDEFVVTVTEVAKPTASSTTICSGQSASLTATGAANATLTWYSDATLQNIIQEGGLLNTPILTANTTYYVTQTVGGCTSEETEVTVTITTPAAAPGLDADETEVCSGGTSVLTSDAGANTVWYSDAGITQVGTGATFTTPALLSTTTYYARDEANANCPSLFASITISITDNVQTPNVQGTSICSGQTATLTGGTTNTVWYSDALLTAEVETGASYTTPALTANTTYYVRNENGDCVSDVVEVLVTVNAIPAEPTASGTTICSGQSASLLATGSANATLTWFSDATLQNMIQEGGLLNTPILTANTTYYVTQTVGGCTSEETEVTVTITTPAAAPGLDADESEVCSGGTSVLTSDAGANTVWYSDAGITQVGTGATFTTPALLSTTTYYARDEANANCPSLFASITISITDNVETPNVQGKSICSGQTATLTGGTTNTVWYSDALLTAEVKTGASYTTPALTANTTYYVRNENGDCVSDVVEVLVTVNAIPAEPTASGTTICNGQSASLLATGAANSTLTWFSDATLQNMIQEGGLLNTPILTANTTYYVTQTLNNCSSTSRMVTVSVTAPAAAPQITALPTPICSGGTTTLSSNTGASTIWYSDEGVTQVGTGATFTTPALLATTTYYARNNASCPSALNSITILVNPNPQAPVIAGTTICAGQTTTLTGGTANTIWYSNPALTTQVGTGATYTTPALTTNTTYYARNQVGTCVSSVTQILVTVNPVPIAPTVSGNNPVCVGESITLTANCTSSSARWYNNTNQLVFVGYQYTINNPQNGQTYSVECTNENCTSSRANVTLTVNPAPQLPIGVADYTICQGQTIPNGEGLQASCTSGNSGGSGSVIINGTGGNFFIGNDEPDGIVSFDATALPANALVTSVSLTMSLSHVYAGDVEIDLVNPGGSIIAVHDGNGGNDNFINANTYTFSNTGTSTIDITPAGDLNIPAGNYLPVQSFTAFNNTNASGIWTLEVGDNFPSSDDGQFNSASLTINYIVPASAGDITWWDAPVGGNELSNEGTFVPNNYSSLTPGEYTYYAQCGNTTTCANARTEVKFTVLPALAPPTISGSDPICSGTSAVLEADDAIGTVEWYADAELTTLLATGLTFNTPNLSANTTYYAINNNGQCNSVPAAYTVEVTPLPTFLFGTFPQASSSGNIEICEGEKVNAFALLDDPDNQVALLYTEARPINPLQDWLLVGTDDGTGFVEFEINTTSDAIYYVRVVDLVTGCISNPRRIYIDVFNRREAPEVEGTTVCVNQDAIVKAYYTNFVNDFNPENDAVELILRDAEGNFLDAIEIDPANNVTTAEFNVGSFVDAGTYSFLVSSVVYHLDNDIFYCESYPTIVNVNVVDGAEVTETTNDTICIGEVAMITAESNLPITWYSDMNKTNVVGTGNTLTIPGLTQTTNYYAVASNGTCESDVAMATVVVNPLPTKPVVNANSPVCEGATILLSTTTTGNVTYNWTGPNGYTSNIQNPEITPAVKATHQGIYTLTITDNITGCTSMSNSVQLDINPAPQAPTASNNGPVCEGTSAVISASLVAGAAYSWTGPNGYSSSLQVNTIMNVSTTAAGDYSVSIYKDGCWSPTATTTLVVNPKPIVTIDNIEPLCEHQTLTITSATQSTVQTYSWTGPNNYTNNTSTVVIQNVNETDHQGAYTLQITDNNGCKSDIVATWVVINKYPDNIIATNNGPKCEGEDIQLDAPNIFDATYSWSGPNQFVSGLRNPILQDVTVANAGTYTLVVSLGDCSSAPVTTEVVVHANPTANAGLDDTIYLEQPYKLNGSGGNDYLWTTGDYLSTINIPNPIFLPDTVGIYTKTLTVWDNSTGCSDDDEVVITVLPSLTPTIPDLITPNGDGINDVWKLTFLNNIKESYVIGVYARGGALVMSTSNYNQDWSGTYKDKQLPDGAYWYAIELSNGVVYKGTLTIKR